MEDDNNNKQKMSISINLPDEIILEIILCLPIKSLIRFRCVNKTWLQLLTNDSQFAQLYLTKSGKNKPIFLALRRKQEREPFSSSAVELRSDSGKLAAVPLELPFYSNSFYKIGGIRNGLILVSLYDDKQNLIIWNPLTNDYIVIPYPPIVIPRSAHCGLITSFGFGFIQATNQYKVIRFCDCYEDLLHPKSHVSVYTLGVDSSWRNLKDISYHSIVQNCTAPLVNGALHWNADIYHLSFDSNILTFNMKDEIFGEIPYPKHIYASRPHTIYNLYDTVGELDGLLCMLIRDWEENIQVWVMKEYGVTNSWTKQYTIGQPDISGRFTFMQPIGVPQKEKTLLQIRTDTPQVILYNPETKSITDLKEFGLHLYAAYAYTPSLISPRVISGDGDLLAVRHTVYTSPISPRATKEGVGVRLARRRRQKELAKKVVTRERWNV
ncbi:F-box protein cpr1 [Thalictrum thalictroides]|uniref:F-box protein cpr1 n=1 Tax=Thalictrum thalictroides TaxID=46969 RepID=A0A7J6WK66_THATH|nr:F-box protein cpr1 [Thalictrum thalictroides]